MKTNWKRSVAALLIVLTLALSLLAGCGNGGGNTQQPDDSAAAGNMEPDASQPEKDTDPAVPPEDPTAGEPEGTQPEDTAPEDAAPEDNEASQPEDEEPQEPGAGEDAPEDVQPEDTKPQEAQPEDPVPAAPEETDPVETPLEDGNYTASVTLEGGSGRASVESPAKLRCENGQFWATIVWSSSNYDYMKVDGVRYELVNTEGNSTFEIPVAAFDQKLAVIADTVAMSTPHEVEYTLLFDSSTLTKE